MADTANRVEAKAPEDKDVQHMGEALAAMNAIPVHSNRRAAALHWLMSRVSTDIRHAIDAANIEAVDRVLREATKGGLAIEALNNTEQKGAGTNG